MSRNFKTRMVAFKSLVFLLVLSFLWTFTGGDTEVSCVFMKSCILPCSFQAGTEDIIHWILMPGDLPVHSYYRNQDQLTYQEKRFRSRTSLFNDQISGGNASLKLTGVQVQDEGRYKCYTSTIRGNKETFINLKVDAPVSKINIEQVENRINCSSEGIYPEPKLTWSISPPSTFKNTTRVQQTEQQLYNISSSLMLSEIVTDVDYSCRISTGRNTRRATYFKQPSVSVSNTETIRCANSNYPITSFIWRFNHKEVIVDHTGATVVTKEWRPYVKEVSDTGNLTLQDLTSNQEGVYTCEVTSAEETHVSNTFVRMEKRQDTTSNGVIAGAIVGVVIVLVVAVAVAVGLYHFREKLPFGKKKKGSNENNEKEAKQSLRTKDNDEVKTAPENCDE